MSYAGNWHGSGQIPARAVEQGLDLALRLDRSRRGRQHRAPPARAAVQAAPDREQRAAGAGLRRRRTASTCSRTSRSTCATPTTATRSSRSIGARSTAAKVSYRVVHQLGRRALRHDHRRRRAQRRHPRGALEHACTASSSTRRAQQRRARDASSAPTSTRRSRPRRWLRVDVGGRADLLVVRRRQPPADDRSRRARRAASAARTSSAPRRA